MRTPHDLTSSLLSIQNEWTLSAAQMAGILRIDEATYLKWTTAENADPVFTQESNDARVPTATVPAELENAPPLISIFKNLRRLLPEVEAQVKWLTQPNSDFGDNLPVDILASSRENLSWMSYYLESANQQVALNAEAAEREALNKAE